LRLLFYFIHFSFFFDFIYLISIFNITKKKKGTQGKKSKLQRVISGLSPTRTWRSLFEREEKEKEKEREREKEKEKENDEKEKGRSFSEDNLVSF